MDRQEQRPQQNTIVRKNYFRKKIAYAESLCVTESKADYSDVCIVLCAILSACAAIRWPGKNIDKARFIELLIMHSKPEHGLDLVSIPTLMNDKLIHYSDTPYSKPGQSNRIFIDEEIDLRFSDAKSKFKNLDEKELKSRTYASLIYEWIRCGYAHEYLLGGYACQVPASRQKARVSYIQRIEKDHSSTVMMSFHLDYLFEISQHHVEILPGLAEPEPLKWWKN